jgi:hypothetical protein
MKNYQFGDVADDRSRAGRIRDAFVSGTTIHEHTEKCMRDGVWTETEIRGMAMVQARHEVRSALGQLTEEGVPFAGPTISRRDKVPVWRQLELWSKRDFDYNFTAYQRRANANRQVAENIARLCRERFGRNPVFWADGEAN